MDMRGAFHKVFGPPRLPPAPQKGTKAATALEEPPEANGPETSERKVIREHLRSIRDGKPELPPEAVGIATLLEPQVPAEPEKKTEKFFQGIKVESVSVSSDPLAAVIPGEKKSPEAPPPVEGKKSPDELLQPVVPPRKETPAEPKAEKKGVLDTLFDDAVNEEESPLTHLVAALPEISHAELLGKAEEIKALMEEYRVNGQGFFASAKSREETGLK